MGNAYYCKVSALADEALEFERFVSRRVYADGLQQWLQACALRILVFDTGDKGTPEDAFETVADAFADTYVLAFTVRFGGRNCVLVCAGRSNAAAISRKSLDGTLARLGIPACDAPAGCSQLFYAPEDLPFAYQQAVYALANYASANSFMRQCSADEDFEEGIVPYGLVVPLLVARGDVPRELLHFTLGNGLISELRLRESRSGVSLAHLVWSYLLAGRNARKVAERLYMHRNTVAYQIKRIEEDYAISFEDPLVCSVLRLECMHLLCDGQDDVSL